jgi:NADPH:quinone reductase-like Zn-dependent oxidoreductase
VFGIAEGCLGSAVVAGAQGLVPVPLGTSWEGAATLPTVFLTATAALSGLEPPADGSNALTLMLPAATGGVGLAALQVRGGLEAGL